MTTHSSILAWIILWTEEPGGLQSMSLKESNTIEGLTLYKWSQTVFLSISLISLQVLLWVLQDGTWLKILPGISPLIQPQSKMTMEAKEKMLVAQLCLTLCHPMDCSPPGSSVHGILQARILEWVAISFSGGSSQSRDWTWVSSIAGRFFTIWATRKWLPNFIVLLTGHGHLDSLRKN